MNRLTAQFQLFNRLCITEMAIEITFDRDPVYKTDEQQADLHEVICRVPYSTSNVDFSLWYNGAKKAKARIMTKRNTTQKSGHYYHATYQVIMRLPDSGSITCKATDACGSASKTKIIRARGMYLLSKKYILNKNSIIAVI